MKSTVISPGLPASATVPHSTKGRKPVGICMWAVIKVGPYSVWWKLPQLLLLLWWQKTDKAILRFCRFFLESTWIQSKMRRQVMWQQPITIKLLKSNWNYHQVWNISLSKWADNKLTEHTTFKNVGSYSVWGTLGAMGQSLDVLKNWKSPPEDHPGAKEGQRLWHREAICLLFIKHMQEEDKFKYLIVHNHSTCMNISTVWWIL